MLEQGIWRHERGAEGRLHCLESERCTLREGLGHGPHQAAFALVRGSNEGQIEAAVKCRDSMQRVGENCVAVGWAGERQFRVVIWGVVSGARLPGYLLCLPSLSPVTPEELSQHLPVGPL